MIHIIDDKHYIAEYLHDESRLTGNADSISFPETEDEIRELAAYAAGRALPLTVQGSRTGITGGAVPRGGHILNLSRMNRITGLRYNPDNDRFYLTAQPGLKLQELNRALAGGKFDTGLWDRESLSALEIFARRGRYFFPPDPTETTASLGGMAACNASGARSFLYGPTRHHIRSLRVILADGGKLSLARGAGRANKGIFILNTIPDGSAKPRTISGRVPTYKRPAGKNAAGYFSGEDMELIDLFIGSEGTLGVISEMELVLQPVPACVWGGVFFLSHRDAAADITSLVRTDGMLNSGTQNSAQVAAVEFFDSRALELAASFPGAGFPKMPGEARAALYFELHGNTEESVSESFLHLAEILQNKGENAELNWLAANTKEMQKLTAFRHTVPEAVNLLIDRRKKTYPQLTKLGTDMAVPDEKLADIFARYRSVLVPSGLDFTMFGHIGDNHIHINIIPRKPEEHTKGKVLYRELAGVVLNMGGTISAEHGIGKLKPEFLEAMYGKDGITQMKALKRYFDPACVLGRGNLWKYGK